MPQLSNAENPYQPPYEKLSGNLTGYYSRRINIKHRLIYAIDENDKKLKLFVFGHIMSKEIFINPAPSTNTPAPSTDTPLSVIILDHREKLYKIKIEL